jgi:hypothetical protein
LSARTLLIAAVVAVLVCGGAAFWLLSPSGVSGSEAVIDGQTFSDDCNGLTEGGTCLGPDTLGVTGDGRGGFVVVFDGEFRAGDRALWARRVDADGEPVGDVRRLATVSKLGPPIDVVAGVRGGRVVVQRNGRELVLTDDLRVVRTARARRPVKPAGLSVHEDPAGLRRFVLPGTPGVMIYIDATDKHVHAASCDAVDCGGP